MGGLLVARSVTLDAKQEGTRRVLADAMARGDVAKARAEEARQERLEFEIDDFFGRDASEAVKDAAGLRASRRAVVRGA
ncbi:hypothetical protein [Streptomyces lutosisoli]|uniref:Uncharacterized protein n=1 Tax=Streptomyces lutosisoli TaxID=2665721 RepID=A0ABW2VYY3_9ACTN